MSNIVYTSPCGRAQVERRAPRQFVALLNGQPLGAPHSFAYQAQAQAAGALSLPAVTVEPCICTDEVDTARLGSVIGYDYVSEVDGVKVIGWVPNEPGEYNNPGVILDGYDVIPVARAQAILRALSAVLSDSRFLEAAAAPAPALAAD